MHMMPTVRATSASLQKREPPDIVWYRCTWKITPDDQRDLAEPQFLLGNLERIRLSLELDQNGCVHTTTTGVNMSAQVGDQLDEYV